MIRIAALALLLSSCGDEGERVSDQPHTQPGWSVDWSNGATMLGDTLTVPAFPAKAGTITKPCDLRGKTRISARFRIEGELHPYKAPDMVPLLTLYFQREGDDWSARGEKEAYRWFASFATVHARPGEYQIEAPLDANWTAVLTSSQENNPEAFSAAVKDCARIGFVLGGGDGLAHGVAGPGTVTVMNWTIN